MEAPKIGLITALKSLKDSGLKSTTARRVVLETLLSSEGHLTAEDILNRVKTTHPEIHLSTIYRTLDALEGAGVVDHVHLGHGRAVYHLQANPHQHLVCEICGGVIQVPESQFADLEDSLLLVYGFQIRRNHFAVLGQCSSCRTPSASNPSK